jgi:hypothetical protein
VGAGAVSRRPRMFSSLRNIQAAKMS